MRIIIVRRVRGGAASMDIYADNLVKGLRTVRPTWEIIELEPKPWNSPDKLYLQGSGLRKFYETYWRYPLFVQRHDADIFHIIDQSDGHILRWLKPGKQVSVITCHDLVQFVYPESLQGQSRLPALSLAIWKYSVKGILRANHVIAVSSNTAQDVQKFLSISSEKTTVALNGINARFSQLPQESIANFRQKYEATPETICLLNVGETSPRKNIMTVLKVMAVLNQRGIPVSLWKVSGEFRKDHQEFIQQNCLEAKIVHFNRPDDQTLELIYNSADFLLAPSLYEGFGLTILEAMACGLPVITSNTSALPEVAGDAACLVDPYDVEEMVSKAYLLKYDLEFRKTLIKMGLEHASQFSWEKTSEQVAQVYETLLLK